MEGKKYRRKKPKDALKKILLIPLLLLISYGAIRTGIAIGDMLYHTDMQLVEGMDVENFKSTLNNSFPIINTVYNSGNASISISGEFKSLLEVVFGFNLDSPMTILNAQSPLFFSYYNKEYQDKLAERQGENGVPGNPDPGSSDTTPSPPPAATPIMPSASPEPGSNATPGQASPVPASTPAPTPKDIDGAIAEGLTSSWTYEEDEEKKGNTDIVSYDKIVIHNYSSYKIDIAKLMKEPLKLGFPKKGPKVLIYHTHTTESYLLKSEDIGKKGVLSNRSDPRYNVVRVGEELAQNLRKKFGIQVIHNGTVHDNPHPSAYGASLRTVEKIIKGNPSIRLSFDIHRDGLAKDQGKLRAVTKINGKSAAQIMFVVGTSSNALPNPHWKENLKLAIKLQEKLNKKYPGLAKPIWISSNRYNQHLPQNGNSLIIEVGGDGNLLSECLESTKYLAEAIGEFINE